MSTFLPMSKQQDFMVFWMFIHAGHVYVRLGLSDNFLMTSSECSGHHVQNVQNPYIFPIFIKRIKLLFWQVSKYSHMQKTYKGQTPIFEVQTKWK